MKYNRLLVAIAGTALSAPSAAQAAEATMTGEDLTLGLALLLVGLAIYLLPSVIAFARGHRYRWVIAAINIVIGWTLMGWLGPLVWAVWPSRRSFADPIISDASELPGPTPLRRRHIDELERLLRLKQQGMLTEEEFARERAAILGS